MHLRSASLLRSPSWVLDLPDSASRAASNNLPLPLAPVLIEILDCLKKYGQRLDSELSKETGVPIAKVRQRLAELSATGAIITCI